MNLKCPICFGFLLLFSALGYRLISIAIDLWRIDYKQGILAFTMIIGAFTVLGCIAADLMLSQW